MIPWKHHKTNSAQQESKLGKRADSRTPATTISAGIIHDDRRLVCPVKRTSARGGKLCKFVNFTS
jgi:hypothetical protein